MKYQNKRLFIFLLFVSGVLFVLMGILSIVSAHKTIASVSGYLDTVPAQDTLPFAYDAQLDSLREEKAFLQARIHASQSDSIVLALDIKDSTATLEIKGVTVHKTRIEQMKVSRFFHAIPPSAGLKLLSSPWEITHDDSSIPKIPLMVKIAPRDTSEYTPDIAPDTSKKESVHFVLYTRNGIRLLFDESDPAGFKDYFSSFTFCSGILLGNTWNNFKMLFTFKIPDYKPFIKIRLPKREAKIIYRAIPEKALVVVRF